MTIQIATLKDFTNGAFFAAADRPFQASPLRMKANFAHYLFFLKAAKEHLEVFLRAREEQRELRVNSSF